jgi:hypothetical protein
MPFVQAGDVFKPLSLGNINGIPDAWVGNGIRDFDGSERKLVFALGKLTDTLQTAIPLIIPSWRKDQTSFPDRPLTLPAGVIVNYVALRLPEYGTMFEGVSAPYGLLDQGTTIIGTTGENLKVSPSTGTTHTTTAPAIACANSSYAPDSFATVFRRSSLPDQASPSWIGAPSGSAITPQITVSNAGNTAAGNGVRLSKSGAIAFIIVWFALEFDQAPPRLREVELPIPPN